MKKIMILPSFQNWWLPKFTFNWSHSVWFWTLMLSSGLSLESETVLGPVETDSDSHRPLMSDDEVEVVEVYARVQRSIQQHSEPQVESPQAISFCQAFLLPGVLPVSLRHCFKIHLHKLEVIQTSWSILCCSIPCRTRVWSWSTTPSSSGFPSTWATTTAGRRPRPTACLCGTTSEESSVSRRQAQPDFGAAVFSVRTQCQLRPPNINKSHKFSFCD